MGESTALPLDGARGWWCAIRPVVTAAPARLYVPSVLPHFEEIKQSPGRFKVNRGGRRTGKTTGGLNCAVIGHGPRVNGVRMYKGIGHGLDVIWLAPDYPQGTALWEQEVMPRFAGVPGVEINREERFVRLPGAGALQLRSELNVDGIRGRGKNLAGVIIDEPAKMDLAYAWKRVIRPTLSDNRGWCMMLGTTHLGSYFNQLCEEVAAGKRSADWAVFHRRTRDHAPFPAEEIASLYAEYPPGSSEAAEELDAELLRERGEVFRREWFWRYRKATAQGMEVERTADGGFEFVPFVEVRLYCDLAASLKQSADYTVIRAVGVSPLIGAAAATKDRPAQRGVRYLGVLENVRARLEGPEQLNAITRMAETWRPSRVKVESVAYQLTAVQHLRARGVMQVDELKPDRDKRARSIPGAAAMARREIFWPGDAVAPWMAGLVDEHIRFTGDPKKDAHDDDVDVTGYMGLDLATTSRPFVY